MVSGGSSSSSGKRRYEEYHPSPAAIDYPIITGPPVPAPAPKTTTFLSLNQIHSIQALLTAFLHPQDLYNLSTSCHALTLSIWLIHKLPGLNATGLHSLLKTLSSSPSSSTISHHPNRLCFLEWLGFAADVCMEDHDETLEQLTAAMEGGVFPKLKVKKE